MNNPRVLVVDDDFDIRDSLVQFLRRHHFDADGAHDAEEARRQLGRHHWDLMLLDVMMPQTSGLVLCRELGATERPPIIFLSARAEVVDRIAGLQAGGDDYIAKPFDTHELIERIRAVLRRGRRQSAHVTEEALPVRLYRFDRWRLAVEQRLLTRDDGVVFAIGQTELDLLIAFLDRPGRVMPRERLMTILGIASSDVFDRSIDSRISRIRKKLERDTRHATLIRTVRGDGYVLDATVERE